jgi:dTDP-4-dehydrorhamnose reductase
MLRLSREKKELRIVEDQIGNPTWCRSIAHITGKILKHGLRQGTDRLAWEEQIPSGIYNCSSAGSTSWYGFASEILRSDPDIDGQIVQDLIPISTEELGWQAMRPTFSALSKAKLKATFGIFPDPWSVQLQECWKAYEL